MVVIAPDREQSGVGGALTLRNPVRAREVSFDPGPPGNGAAAGKITAYAVEGTPADCCVLALEKLAGTVDLVVSGIKLRVQPGVGRNGVGDRGRRGAGIRPGLSHHRHIRRLHTRSYVRPGGPPTDGTGQQVERLAARPRVVPERQRTEHGAGTGSRASRSPGWEAVPTASRCAKRGLERRSGTGLTAIARWPATLRPATDTWAAKNDHISITPLHIGLGNPDQIPSIRDFLAGLSADLLDSQASIPADASPGSLLDPS